MKDIMLDLETLDTKPGAVVIAIGAVYFDPKTCRLGNEFYEIINIHSCQEHGLTTDASTLHWWSKQSREAQQVVFDATVSGSKLPIALKNFAEFVSKSDGNACVWGNGSDFDNTILREAYHVAGIKLPWRGFSSRCYRTLKNLVPESKLERVGIHHHALDDAKSQALHACRILSFLHGHTHRDGVSLEVKPDAIDALQFNLGTK